MPQPTPQLSTKHPFALPFQLLNTILPPPENLLDVGLKADPAISRTESPVGDVAPMRGPAVGRRRPRPEESPVAVLPERETSELGEERDDVPRVKRKGFAVVGEGRSRVAARVAAAAGRDELMKNSFARSFIVLLNPCLLPHPVSPAVTAAPAAPAAAGASQGAPEASEIPASDGRRWEVKP